MTFDQLAEHEYRDHLIYTELALREKEPDFKRILTTFAKHEREHYEFWLQFSARKSFSMSSFSMFKFRLLRKILGLTFTARFLERREAHFLHHYKDAMLKSADPQTKEKITAFLREEAADEQQLIAQIKEERVEFLSNIVLGLNDGLIELTGALVGFSFAFDRTLAVALAGSITGISASLSMAASAYMQARHDETRIHLAKKSGVYTGLAYIAVVTLLVTPFVFFEHIPAALICMATTITLIILSISYYTSVLFDRSFARQAGEIALFSIGVALIAFLIGSLFRNLTGIEL